MVDSLEAYFPAGSPVVHLLKAPAAFLETEGAHLKDGGVFQEGSEVIGVGDLPLNTHIHIIKLSVHDQLGTIVHGSDRQKRCLLWYMLHQEGEGNHAYNRACMLLYRRPHRE